jgi:glycerate kinase
MDAGYGWGMRVLVAPDKFKGCLAASEVAEALAAGLPGCEVDVCPIADGGEGFAEALATRWDRVEGVRDPLGRLLTARCGWVDAGTAVIEMSEASGLHRVAAGERNPWEASTYGTGQLIAHAAERGAERVLVGLGSSGTNDAGAGMAAALGWQFLTSDGEPVDPRPSNFLAMERIEGPEDLSLPVIIAACDVRNPLLGKEGCSRVYARQKGADDRMIEHLEMAVEHLAELVAEQVGVDYRDLPGAGAAGGLGYGLATFCGAELRRGFDLVAGALGLEERVAGCDLVITGEGRLDSQTMYGKGPAEVARLAKKYGKPVAIVCGQREAGAGAVEWFDYVVALEEMGSSPEECLRNARELLGRAAGRVAEWGRRV